MLYQADEDDRERRALRTLAEISNQEESRVDYHWNQKSQFKKNKRKKRHKVTASIQNVKPEKLPLIISKKNLWNLCESNQSLEQPNHKPSNYVIFEKGLGSYGSVHFKKRGRYLEENNKFIKMYSQNSEQQINLVKEWLNLKKESSKSYNSLISKRRKPVFRDESHLCLSIKNIL